MLANLLAFDGLFAELLHTRIVLIVKIRLLQDFAFDPSQFIARKHSSEVIPCCLIVYMLAYER